MNLPIITYTHCIDDKTIEDVSDISYADALAKFNAVVAANIATPNAFAEVRANGVQVKLFATEIRDGRIVTHRENPNVCAG